MTTASSLMVIICGTTIELVTTFKDENGNPYDPAEVTAELVEPDGTEVDLDVTRDDTGVYSAPFTPSKNGMHFYRFAGVDPTLSAASEGSFMAETEF